MNFILSDLLNFKSKIGLIGLATKQQRHKVYDLFSCYFVPLYLFLHSNQSNHLLDTNQNELPTCYLLGAGAGAGLFAGGLAVPLGAGATGAVGLGLGFSQ